MVGSDDACPYHRGVILFPDPHPGEPVSVSATLYRTYVQCPQQALGRLQGVYPPDSPASFKGSLAHLVFARHLQRGAIPADEFEQACREEIGGSSLNMKMPAVGVLKPSQLRALVAEVGDLYERFRRFPSDGFRAAEVALEAKPAEGVTIRGKVDAVFDDPEHGTKLIDWKTGANLDDAPVQLSFYSMAWGLEHGELPGWTEAVSVQTGERVGVEPSVEAAQRTADEVSAMVGELRSAFAVQGELERRAGPHCRWCPLLESCTEGAAAASVADSL